jgi:hypothetical protein
MCLERGAHGVDRGHERLEIGLVVGPEGPGDAAQLGRGNIVLHLLLPARGADRAETGRAKTVGGGEPDQFVGDEDLHLSRRRHVRRDLQQRNQVAGIRQQGDDGHPPVLLTARRRQAWRLLFRGCSVGQGALACFLTLLAASHS